MEVKFHKVFGCISKWVRRKAHSEDISLDDFIKFARAIELSCIQAEVIEDTNAEGIVNKLHRPGYIANFIYQTKTSRKTIPGRKNVLAAEANSLMTVDAKTCNRCKKLNHFGRFCKSNSSNVQSTSKINRVVNIDKEDGIVENESDVSSGDE